MRRLPPNHGSTVLTLGILSFVVCPFVMALIAIILGAVDLKAIREGNMDPLGESQVRAGLICGIISLSLYGGLVVLIVALSIFVG